MKDTILIIDDDEKLCDRLARYLGGFGYDVLTALRPSEGLAIIDESAPSLVILDVMMPEMDGFEALGEMRRRGDIPVIMLTARGDVDDRIAGLELGADDYLPKPFDPRELLARIQTVLRRHRAAPERGGGKTLRFRGLAIDDGRGAVELDGEPVAMTDLEFRILSALVSRRGRVMDRESLLDSVKGASWEAEDRSIDVAVSRIRQKLGDDPRSPRFIKTLWGEGYMFIGEEER